MDWKHLAIGCGLAVGVPLVHYLIGVNWAPLGTWAPVIGGVLSVANEVLTGAKS